MVQLIYNIRGTNGSGKTTFNRRILEESGAQPIAYRGPTGKKVEAYAGVWNGLSVVILGAYTAACGGMDTVTSIDERVAMIHKYATQDYDIMLLEGLMMSHAIGRMGVALQDYPHVLAFLDTPLQTCIDRVVARREAKGNMEPFDPRNVESDHKAVGGCYRNCIAQGLPAVLVDHKDVYGHFILTLKSKGLLDADF